MIVSGVSGTKRYQIVVGDADDFVEGVMSGIISDPAFNDMFKATKDDDTMQATVTAVYEVGEYRHVVAASASTSGF